MEAIQEMGKESDNLAPFEKGSSNSISWEMTSLKVIERGWLKASNYLFNLFFFPHFVFFFLVCIFSCAFFALRSACEGAHQSKCAHSLFKIFAPPILRRFTKSDIILPVKNFTNSQSLISSFKEMPRNKSKFICFARNFFFFFF